MKHKYEFQLEAARPCITAAGATIIKCNLKYATVKYESIFNKTDTINGLSVVSDVKVFIAACYRLRRKGEISFDILN